MQGVEQIARGLSDEALAMGAGLMLVRKACLKCGAANEATAASRCQPVQDQTGEYVCPGSDYTDPEGFFLQPSAGSLREMDEACGRLMAAQEAAESDH